MIATIVIATKEKCFRRLFLLVLLFTFPFSLDGASEEDEGLKWRVARRTDAHDHDDHHEERHGVIIAAPAPGVSGSVAARHQYL